ncbi:MAG: hypothetical protein ACM3PP_10830 [Candidatus Saccharibacteria bacterium]
MQDHRKIIDLLIEHEKAFARLYRVYSEHFPEHTEFWRSLAAEEEDHADWIRRLQNEADEGKLFIKDGRFNEKSIQSSLKYVTELIESAQNNVPLLINALSTSLWSERAMIEQKFIEIFAGDSAELGHTLSSLQEHTHDHISRLENVLNEVKQRGY